MSSIARATLPENYIDLQSAKLLCQPEPQYQFAQLFLDALGSQLPMPVGLGLEGRTAPQAGDPYVDASRNTLTLAQKKMPSDIFAIGVDFNKQKGDTIKINRPLWTNSTYSEASRALTRGQVISTTGITVGSEQTNLTLKRYGGPYLAGTGVVPYQIESFDANMGINNETAIVGANLVRDFHKFLDGVHVDMCDVGTAVYPDGMTQDNDATQALMYPMTLEQINRTAQIMSEQSLPTFGDGKRLLMLTPAQWKQLMHDPEYEGQASFHPEFNLLFGNYVATVGRFHILESMTLKAPLNASSIPVQRGVAFAPGAFMGGVGRLPRVASSTADNYGETALAIWLADFAFGVADSRFIYTVRSA